MPIIIPRLGDKAAASVDERDEHLMLLEAARQTLDVEWTETLAAAEDAGDHDVMGYPSTVAYLKHRLRMAGGRASRYVRNARAALKHAATFSAWKHRQLCGDEAELMFRTSEQVPDKYPDAENGLLELVGDSYDETRKILDYWKTEVDTPGLELEDQLEGVKYLISLGFVDPARIPTIESHADRPEIRALREGPGNGVSLEVDGQPIEGTVIPLPKVENITVKVKAVIR